jgi:2-dehydro-3-deoxyphosphogluconate aldolase/(4S)-4-hydroxy-2-oxoglutarate aldolase
MPAKNAIIDSIYDQGMLPMFYHDDFDISLKTITTLFSAGVRVIEYTNRGNQALRNFTQLHQVLQAVCPGILLGIGTIKTITEAGEFINAGADFIVSPLVDAELGDYIVRNGRLWIPGAMTPTEISHAQRCGAPLIKIFPADVLGTEFLNAVREIFPGQHFIATGGIGTTRQNLSGWFNAGAYAVGLGSRLVTREILQEAKYDELFEKTLNVIALTKQLRS